MLNETFNKTEQEIIGTIWQNSEIFRNMRYLADEIGSRFAGTESERKAQDYIIEKLKGKLDIISIEELKDMAYDATGGIEKLDLGEEIVGITKWIDGSTLDIIKRVKD